MGWRHVLCAKAWSCACSWPRADGAPIALKRKCAQRSVDRKGGSSFFIVGRRAKLTLVPSDRYRSTRDSVCSVQGAGCEAEANESDRNREQSDKHHTSPLLPDSKIGI